MEREKLTTYLFLALIVIFGGLLRLYHVDTVPPGLYIDEISIGYNAASIIATGKDEHGISYPFVFQAFGEYKLPVYIYLTVLSILAFGTTEFAVRAPSIFFGTGTLILVFFLMQRFSIYLKQRNIFATFLPLLTALLLAISPWHIQFSRAGFEATVALFFFMAGVLLFIVFQQKKVGYLFGLAILFFILSLLTYNSYRVLAPLVVTIGALYLFFTEKPLRKTIVFGFISFGMLSVLLLLLTPSFARFSQISAFSQYQALPFFSKLLWYPMIFLKNYLSFFSFDFLFVQGDGMGRHQITEFGLLFRWQLPFIVLGLVTLLREKRNLFSYFVLFLIVLAPISGALTQPSPHSLRFLLAVVPFTILCAYGLLAVFAYGKRYVKLFFIPLLLVVFFEFFLYLHFYYIHYPRTNIPDWGSGYKEIVSETASLASSYDEVWVDSTLPYAPLYFSFYNRMLHPVYIDKNLRPDLQSKKKILWVTAYGRKWDHKLVHNVYIPTVNHDVTAQFWEL